MKITLHIYFYTLSFFIMVQVQVGKEIESYWGWEGF